MAEGLADEGDDGSTAGDTAADGLGSDQESRSTEEILSEPCCKLGRVATDYDFIHKVDVLGRQWEKPNGESLRGLARRFNKIALKFAIYDTYGVKPNDDAVESIFKRLWYEDDYSEAEIEDAKERVRQYGVDPEDLQDDFISYHTIDRHFPVCEGREEIEDDDAPTTVEKRVEELRKQQNQYKNKAVELLERTINDGEIDLEGFDVTISAKVYCERCHTQTRVTKVLQEGCPGCQDEGEHTSTGHTTNSGF